MSIQTFIPIFVFFVIIVISVSITMSMKSEKKKKEDERRNKYRQQMQSRLGGNGGANIDPFADRDPFVPEQEQLPLRTYVTPVPFKADTVAGTDLVETTPKVHTSAQVLGVTGSHHDDHCDVDGHEEEDLYIVEKVPVSGSIDGKSEEGCSEHYDLRFVKIDESDSGSGKFVVSPEDLRKAIILGEVINDPAYKK